MKFSIVVDYFEKLSKTSSRLEMTTILYELFLKCPKEQLANLVYFCQGNLDAKYKNTELNIGPSIVLSLIAEYVGQDINKIKNDLYNVGDVGLVIENNYTTVKQKTLFSKDLDFSDVFNTFKKIASLDGKGSTDEKQKLFKYILFNCDATAAKYVVRFPISFRLGFGDSTIIDALALIDKSKEQSKNKEIITSKYLLVSDLGLIANLISDKGMYAVEELKITSFVPIKSQLCERSKDFKEIVERLSKEETDFKFAVDTKVDGFRQQIHKFGNSVKIFTRQAEEVTDMFPDIVEAVKQINSDFIIDCEAIGFDTENNRYHTFQITMQRKRKYDVLQKSKELPLHLKIFDIFYLDGKEVFSKPFIERRKIVEDNFNYPPLIQPTKMIITDKVDDLKEFFNDRISKNLEGIIAKDLNSSYKAGSRGYSWIKYKKSYSNVHDTIDAVVIGAFYGQGKRSDKGIGALLMALYDPVTSKYYTVAKLGSGLTDELLVDLSQKLESTKLSSKPQEYITNIEADYFVEPNITIEINFDEITRSNVHTACLDPSTNQGLALRFPRFVKLRYDKQGETNSLETLNQLYTLQDSTSQ